VNSLFVNRLEGRVCFQSVTANFSVRLAVATFLTSLYPHVGVNVHAPTGNKLNDVNDSFYEEFERGINNFLNYIVNMLPNEEC
jgi:hypothetical protein